MRIAFIVIGNSRRSNYLNGHNLRYGGASGSGTDTSCILVAEYLAKIGHEVVFVKDEMEPALEEQYSAGGKKPKFGEQFYGVKYTNKDFDGIDNLEFDILITMLWFKDYENLKISVTKALIYWSHMQWIYSDTEMLAFVKKHNLSFIVVHISKWEKSMTDGCLHQFRNNNAPLKQVIIPNPIFDEIINEVSSTNIPKKKGKFIFHASWARGAAVAYDAFRKLDIENKEFHAFDYLMTIHDYEEESFFRYQGVDKKTLFTHLAESEYFIYPLYTPYKDVHKDTFCCVVAEAIALGVIPITYRLGALPEYFEGYCEWLDFPEGSNPQMMQKEALSKDEKGIFKATDSIIDKINNLEKNPHLKQQLMFNGREYIISRFGIDAIGEMWQKLIEEYDS